MHKERLLLSLLAVSVFTNALMAVAFLTLAVKMPVVQSALKSDLVPIARPVEQPPLPKLTEPPPILAPAAAPPIHVNVPLPRPKPSVQTVAPRKKVHKHRKVTTRHVHIPCQRIPLVAYQADANTIRSVMRNYGATERQVREVLACVAKRGR